ncbi:MAG: caspase family protein, partial [Gammaproteobacteria bacterium]|nr:caspase family protein [Gammaproteobacteria bacterium]
GMARTGGDLLMAGCLDTQFSWDTRFNGRPNGAFTFYALKTLAALGPDATYAEWFRRITPAYLPTNQLPQNPQLFGSASARKWKVFA